MTLKHLAVISLLTLTIVGCKKESQPQEPQPELIASKEQIALGEKVNFRIANYVGEWVWWSVLGKNAREQVIQNRSEAFFTFLEEGTYTIEAIIVKDFLECPTGMTDSMIATFDTTKIRLYKTITVTNSIFDDYTKVEASNGIPLGDTRISLRPRIFYRDSTLIFELVGTPGEYPWNQYFVVRDSSISDSRIRFTIEGSAQLPDQSAPKSYLAYGSSTFHFTRAAFSWNGDFPIEITMNGKLYTGVIKTRAPANEVELLLYNGDENLSMDYVKFPN